MSVLLTVGLISLAIIATFVVVYVLPATAASLLRYKLWPIRDELTDALRNGEFRDPEQPQRLLRDVETAINGANELRPLRMIVLVLLGRRHIRVPPDWAFNIRAANEADIPRLDDLFRQYQSAILRHVLFGSYSGLLLAAVLLPALAVTAAMRGRDGDDSSESVVEDMKQVVKRELPFDPTLLVLSERPQRKKALSGTSL